MRDVTAYTDYKSLYAYLAKDLGDGLNKRGKSSVYGR
jgi:hypothetical protein